MYIRTVGERERVKLGLPLHKLHTAGERERERVNIGIAPPQTTYGRREGEAAILSSIEKL